MQKFFSDAAAFVAREKKRRLWIGMVLVLACAVVLATACALIRPATALDAPVTYCGKEEHVHTDACYTRELTCGQEESAGHTHTDACYEDQRVLVCGQEESAEHTHTDACYETQKVLVCGQEESAGHTHTDACYSEVLTCGKEEHTHTDACYIDPDADNSASTDSGDKETDKTAAGEDGEGSASSSSSSTTQGDGTASSAPQNGMPEADGDQPENAPAMMSNDIMPMAITSGEQYAIVDRESVYAMTSDLQGKAVEINAGDPITINGDPALAVWKLEKRNNQYYIEYQGKYLDVATNGYSPYLKLSSSTKSWTLSEQSDGTYIVYCTKQSTNFPFNNITYYLTCDDSGNFSVTTSRQDAARLYFVEKENIVSGGGDSGDSQTIQGLTPSGTVINLFDYSVAASVDQEMGQPKNANSGINAGHALKFTTGAGTDAGTVNAWTGAKGGVLQGIVGKTLQDGYPVLSGDSDIFSQIHDGVWAGSVKEDKSLQYLFDPTVPVEIDGVAYKASYPNVGGLLQIDDEGYYYYDCAQNYAEFNDETDQFTLYNKWKVQYTPSGGSTKKGQFFPFKAYDEVSQSTTPGDNVLLNYYFGMTLTTRFVQDYGGHTDSSKEKATTFEFSGDDDVWIFIDDVLVADLGGIHLEANVDINFADGTVKIDQVYENGHVTNDKITTLEEAFTAAGKTVSEETGWTKNDQGKWIFADDTYHTLKFFYLERGGFASNMMVKYNLKSIPTSSIVKVDQYGESVSGAEFALYAADTDEEGNYQYKVDGKEQYVSLQEGQYTIDDKGVIRTNSGDTITPIYYGTTAGDGKMTFVDDDGMPLALSDLQELGGTTKFILRETKIPEGYRGVSDEVWMYLEDGILYADNTYDSGTWAAANALVTASDTIYLNDTSAITNGQVADVIKAAASDATTDGDQVKLSYYDLASEKTDVTGTLFAVVLKYNGPGNQNDLRDQKNWVPVYGNELLGYSLNAVPNSGDRTSFITTVIDTAKMMESDPDNYGHSVFSLASSGSMQVLLTQLPDDMKSYYSVLLRKHSGNMDAIAQELGYTVAYYWTAADSLDGATAGNTFRVNAEAADSYGYDGFERTFGASIEVPNLVNRLFVQKIGENADGTKVPIDGAVFALYSVEQEDGSDSFYYLADDGTEILLDKATQNKGTAKVKGNETPGTYTVNAQTGVITAEIGGNTYTITPEDVQTTSNNTIAKEDGTAVFTNTEHFTFTQGTYCVREISAPAGYEVNNTEIQVLVDDTAIYANAGTATDGVSVGRGPGYVVKPLLKSAAFDYIDNTLTWVYARMQVTGESTKFSDAYLADQYVTDYSGQGFGATTSTGNATNAMTAYLVYAPDSENTLFNYKVNEEQAGGTGTRRLYTSVGWADYEIYQDTDFGEANKNDGAEYTDLKGKDISNLFSQSTYIQVEDARVSKLKISKTVVDAEESDTSAPENAQFTFTVNLYPSTAVDQTGEALSGSYPYTVYTKASTVGADDEQVRSGTITSGGTISLRHNQYVVIEELPHDAKYAISEASVDKFTASYQIDEANSITSRDTGLQPLKTWNVSDLVTNVAFTNTWLDIQFEPVDLKLVKVDSTDRTKTLANAEFVLYTVQADTSKKYYSSAGNWEAPKDGKTESDYKQSTNSTGEIIFSQLDVGTYHLKELKAPDGYTLRTEEIIFTVRADGSVIGPDNSELPKDSSDRFVLTVTNSAGITLPETGGTGVIGYTCGGLLLMAAAAMYGFVLRRKREGRGK